MPYIQEKAPCILIGGKELEFSKVDISDNDFWERMKSELGRPAEIEAKKEAIIEHLSKSSDNYIEIGNYRFFLK